MGGDSSGSTGSLHGSGKRTIRDEGISPSGVAMGSDTGKGPRHVTVVETGKFDETGVPRGSPPSKSDMDNGGDNTKTGRVVQRDRFSGSYLESLSIHHDQPTMLLHHPE